jgi:hypothetical protein
MSWRDPTDPPACVLIEAGKLYNTRNCGVMLIEEMRVARCTVYEIGQPARVVEQPFWVGTYIDTGSRGTWGFWGNYSPVVYSTNDLVDAVGN